MDSTSLIHDSLLGNHLGRYLQRINNIVITPYYGHRWTDSGDTRVHKYKTKAVSRYTGEVDGVCDPGGRKIGTNK